MMTADWRDWRAARSHRRWAEDLEYQPRTLRCLQFEARACARVGWPNLWPKGEELKAIARTFGGRE